MSENVRILSGLIILLYQVYCLAVAFGIVTVAKRTNWLFVMLRVIKYSILDFVHPYCANMFWKLDSLPSSWVHDRKPGLLGQFIVLLSNQF
jgi:hypothetical protein